MILKYFRVGKGRMGGICISKHWIKPKIRIYRNPTTYKITAWDLDFGPITIWF